MSTTGIDSWAVDLKDIAAVYPFQGAEGLMVVLGLAAWIIWHVWQIKSENKTIAEQEARLKEAGALEKIVKENSGTS